MTDIRNLKPPLEDVLKGRDAEREAIIAYGTALAAERGARRAVEVWREVYRESRDLMRGMNPFDSERLHVALLDAEEQATMAHEAAMAALNALPSPFTVAAAIASHKIGT